MKNLKLFQAALVIAVLSIIVGCSDQFTSPDYSQSTGSNVGNNPSVTDQHVFPLYHTQIRLKPGGIYKFDYLNTGLNSFTSIDVSRVISISTKADKIYDPCSGINVYSDSKSELFCHSKEFSVKQIYVKNTSSGISDLDVVLFGTRPEVKYFGIE